MPRFDDDVIDMRDLLRRLAEQFENAVMDAGADQLCGSGANSRNGYRERSLATCVGTLTLRISKLRSGSFFPEEVIERYQGIDLALVAAVVEMYAIGISIRKVLRVAGKMGISGLSKYRVSAIVSSLDGRHRGAARKTARRLSVALRLARRHLRQVPPRGAVASIAVVTSPASSLRTGLRRYGISTVFQVLGRRADSLWIGCYTNFLDTTLHFIEVYSA